jgi:translation initiation factor IF-3
LEEGDKVKVFVVFRGREFTHPELGLRLLRKVAEDLKDIAVFDAAPSSADRFMSLVLTPVPSKHTKKPAMEEKV